MVTTFLTAVAEASLSSSLGVIINSVSSLGFPIVMCFIIMRYMKEKDEVNRVELKELSTAIDNNTLVITKLLERIGGDVK